MMEFSEKTSLPMDGPGVPDSLDILGRDVFVNSVVNYQTIEASHAKSLSLKSSRVLVLYVGGTIGMKMTEKGYIPVTRYLETTLRSMPQFHDAQQGDELTLPVSIYGKKIQYEIRECYPLLDSSDMEMRHWVNIANDIDTNYKEFDAFVILHGTDTMVYTCSALSFMLENLSKTVIVTGSQIPLSEVRNDAHSNLFDALTLAGHFCIPEVCLYFNSQLFRGNRAKKVDNINFRAFESPNFPLLGTVGINIEIYWERILKVPVVNNFKVHEMVLPKVAIVYIYPGMKGYQLNAMLEPTLQGVILCTFGAGNIPQTDLLQVLEKSIAESDLIIVNCTQCARGIVSDLYASGRALSAIGIVPGYDMTIECAFTKLSYLLSQSYSKEEIRRLMQTSLHGELVNIQKMVQQH